MGVAKEEEKVYIGKLEKGLEVQKSELIRVFQDVKSRIESSNQSHKGLSLLLNECDTKLKRLETMDVTINNIVSVREEMEKLMPAVLSLLSEEELDNLGKEYEKI